MLLLLLLRTTQLRSRSKVSAAAAEGGKGQQPGFWPGRESGQLLARSPAGSGLSWDEPGFAKCLALWLSCVSVSGAEGGPGGGGQSVSRQQPAWKDTSQLLRHLVTQGSK